MRRLALAALLSVAVAGCGASSTTTGPAGRATVWVTRDRGAEVLHVAKVPAGLSAMQGLLRVAKVKTRYGGRYVDEVEGLEEEGDHSWFYYVNGYLADRGATEYRLRPGDVEWWDYRSWRNPLDDPVVAGAFPEPLLHGYDGERRRTFVVGRGAPAVATRLRARIVAPGKPVPASANVLVLRQGPTSLTVRLRTEGSPPGSPVWMEYTGDPGLLLRERPFRFHYEVRP